jgi:hypothetical protein
MGIWGCELGLSLTYAVEFPILACRSITYHEKCKGIPIVMATSKGQKADIVWSDFRLRKRILSGLAQLIK